MHWKTAISRECGCFRMSIWNFFAKYQKPGFPIQIVQSRRIVILNDVVFFGAYSAQQTFLEIAMPTRLNITMSDELNSDIDAAAAESENSRSDIFRKALLLYFVALDGKRRGLKLGLVNADTQKIETEIVGL